MATMSAGALVVGAFADRSTPYARQQVEGAELAGADGLVTYHWMSDVLVGVAAGSAMGFAISYFAHWSVRIVPAGNMVSVVGGF